MKKQHINEIPLGTNSVMKEFFLEPGVEAPVPVERDVPNEKDLEMDRLVELYHNENFLEVCGRKIPAILDDVYNLSDITMETIDGSFEPSERFRKAINSRKERALENLLRNGGHDGRNVSVRDWHFSDNGIKLIGQPMTYTQFRSTDAAQDELLRPDDKSFPESSTLRDYVVVNGLESRKGTDILSNLLGAAFVLRAKGQDEQDYFVLARKQKGMSEGGELCVVGGTPMWEEEYFGQEGLDFAGNAQDYSGRRPIDFPKYMRKLGKDEHWEELRIYPDEIEIGNGTYMVRTLVRVFDPFYTVDVINENLTVEGIAARCYGDEEALEEHDRIYAVPRTMEALDGLINCNRGFSIGQGTIAGLYLAIKDENKQKATLPTSTFTF